MIRLLATILGAGILAAVAMWSGLDRLSESGIPSAARYIPAALEFRSPRSLAQQAIVREQPEQALEFARQAVSADPMHSASSAILGLSRAATGDAKGADEAFRIAALFGWREPATQLYWYQQSVALGEWKMAADRLDAILRVRPGISVFDQIIAPFEQNEESRAQLVRLLAGNPEWLPRYVASNGSTDENLLLQKAHTLTEVGQLHGPLGCDGVEKVMRELMRRGLRAPANAMWQANCSSSHDDGLLQDPGFEQTDFTAYDPLGWSASPNGQMDVQIVPAKGDGKQLRLRNGSSVTRAALSQPLDLPAGNYLVTADVMGRSDAIRMVAGCGKAEVPRGPAGDLGAGGQLLTVETCPDQMLTIFVAGASGEVLLDNLKIRPAS